MGVEVVEGRKTHTVPAGEVILYGVAINSPQLLQLSGVRDARELGALGVSVVHDLPGVGENVGPPRGVSQDRREWVEAARCAREILTQQAFDPFNDGEIPPGPSVETPEQNLDWGAKDGETALHPSCTCKMGTGPDAVVDPASLSVHGLERLHVVDASARPYVTNGNIYAPVVMLAEKAADLIRGNSPLAPSKAQFYRHHDAAADAPGAAATASPWQL